MPTYSNFLNLTLPELGEFVDSWNEPNNANFETIDNWTEDLYNNLVGVGSGSTWAALRGTAASLSARLAVAINPDGTVNIAASSDLIALATSAYRGQFADPATRLDDGDKEVYGAGQPVPDGRFAPMLPAGPSAGFPHADLDASMALRSADFGAETSKPISSPHRPWAPGLITGGAGSLLTAPGGTDQVQLNAATVPAIFNIDGYVFRIREDIVFDYSAIAPGVGDYVWIYVERKEANYNDANFLYSEPGGTPAAKDLRILRSGADGTTSNSTFTVGSGTFNTLPFRVKEGDILRITSGGAAGDYVIDALDGVTPNTKLTIKGIFKDNLGPTVPYQIIDNAMPNIGAAVSTTDPTQPYNPPPFEEGRVYIGRVLSTGGVPSNLVTFTKGGVFDSGWQSAVFPLDVPHDLGVIPSSIEIWVRVDGASRAYRPLVQRQIVVDFDETPSTVDPGDAKKTTLLVPSLFVNTDEIEATVDILNASPDVPGQTVDALFTDALGVDQAADEIRVICRR